MRVHGFRAIAPLIAVSALVLPACINQSIANDVDSQAPSTSRTRTEPPPPTDAAFTEAISDLDMTPTQYTERANEALEAGEAAAHIAATTPGIETVWLPKTGPAIIGTSTREAADEARKQGWTTRPVPTRSETHQRYLAATEWLASQPARIRASIVLMWPDYTTGAVNAARNTWQDPTSAPSYPVDLQIRDVPGTVTPADTHQPIEPELRRGVAPGDAFRTGKTPDTTCTVGVPTARGFLTVEHCTTPNGSAHTVTGEPLGHTADGPTEYTRNIDTDRAMPALVRAEGAAIPISAHGRPVIGAPLCKAGARSGWQCGVTVGLIDDDSFISTSCSLAGDSGGPALIGGTVVGVTDISTIGGQTWCPSQKSDVLAYTVHRTTS